MCAPLSLISDVDCRYGSHINVPLYSELAQEKPGNLPAPLRPERRDRRARRAALARELRVPLADLVELLAQRALAVLVLRDADSNI